MRDIELNQLERGDFFFLAAKASVSHVLKLGYVLDVNDLFLSYICIENDWRGFKISQKLKIKQTILTTFKINETIVPDELKLALFTNQHNFIKEPDKDFFNQQLELNKTYLVAKHENNQSRLVKVKLVEQRNNYCYFMDINEKIIRTSALGRIVRID